MTRAMGSDPGNINDVHEDSVPTGDGKRVGIDMLTDVFRQIDDLFGKPGERRLRETDATDKN